MPLALVYQLYCWGKRSQVQGTGVYQLYRQIQRAHVQNIFYNYLLYPKYSIGGASSLEGADEYTPTMALSK